MGNIEDKTSFILSRAIDILFLKHPIRTSTGIVLGFFIDGLIKIFSPVLNNMQYIDITKIEMWNIVPLGILITHLPTLIYSIYNRPMIDNSIEETIQLIEKSKLSEIEKKLYYHRLIDKVLKEVTLNEKLAKEINQTKMNPIDDKSQKQL